jgi:transcriptional regulator with XRE-family HTH domain
MEVGPARRKQRHDAVSSRLGDALLKARETAGLTQQEVSEGFGGPPKSVISRIEQGAVKDPGFLTVAELAYTYGIGLNDLARRAGVGHVKEIQNDGGWEAVDDRIVGAIRRLLSIQDTEWKEALTSCFFAAVMSKARDEAAVNDGRAEVARLREEREVLLDVVRDATKGDFVRVYREDANQ